MDSLTKNQSFQSSDQLDILVKKALEENTKNGKITIVCPKCLKALTMNISGNRTVVKCECFNVYWEFINF